MIIEILALFLLNNSSLLVNNLSPKYSFTFFIHSTFINCGLRIIELGTVNSLILPDGIQNHTKFCSICFSFFASDCFLT